MNQMVFTLTPHIHKLSFKSKTIFTQKTYSSLLLGQTVQANSVDPDKTPQMLHLIMAYTDSHSASFRHINRQ